MMITQSTVFPLIMLNKNWKTEKPINVCLMAKYFVPEQ